MIKAKGNCSISEYISLRDKLNNKSSGQVTNITGVKYDVFSGDIEVTGEYNRMGGYNCILPCMTLTNEVREDELKITYGQENRTVNRQSEGEQIT